MVSELRPSHCHVGSLDISDFDDDVRHADPRICQSSLPRPHTKAARIPPNFLHRLEVDFWETITNARFERPRRRMEDESFGPAEPQLDGESGAAKAGITAEGGLGAVAIVVAHPDVGVPRLLDEDHPVGSDPGAAGRER